jgi:hypothetical protein
MSYELTAEILRQINDKQIKPIRIFLINGVDKSDYLISSDVKYDRSYGSSAATFTLSNSGGIFGDGGASKIYVGDVVEYQEKYDGDTTLFQKFYGQVEQRSIDKSATSRTITLNCLDYISMLQKIDIDIVVEGDKAEIEEETLTPNYLPAPNDNLAQIFNFANNAIAQEPPPILTIRPQATTTLVGEAPQYDGFQIEYANGQVFLGTPLNALDNYTLVAEKYSFYTQGVFAEDILQTILTQPDGYGKYLFGEDTAQDVIDNHFTTTFFAEQNSLIDYLVPNYTDSDIDIKTILTSAYYTDESGYDPTVLEVLSTNGFPSSGSASVNGDTFTYTGKTATTFTGVSGLSDKPVGSYAKYSATYEAGRVWYLKYSNLSSVLVSGNFSGLTSGITIDYIDYRYGRVILSSAMDVSTIFTHTVNYTFNTLQASGVQLNKIAFRSREVSNRFEAVGKLREYLAPNYVIRTKGTGLIWASYISQKTTADYDLKLTKQMNYLEDEDLYTRVVFTGKNINPTNLMYNDGVAFVDSGQNFKATAAQSELQYEKEEGNFLVYKSTISDAGKIDTSIIKPIVYINNVPVNDKPQVIAQMPVVITVTQRQETSTKAGSWFSGTPTITVRQYWYYSIRFAHTSIDATQTITLYDAVGLPVLTIPPGSGGMNYSAGIYTVPGTERNSTVESISTASYTVFYSLAGIIIDTETVRFSISKQLVPSKDFAIVAATFQYWTAVTPFDNVGDIIDGRFDTQVQTEFYAEPPNGLPYAIIDLGQEYNLQAIDFIAGFYKPDNIRKYDINFTATLLYSLDNITYYHISPETQNISFTGGSSKKFEEKDLGVDFTTRYLRLDLESVKKLENQVRLTITDVSTPVNIWAVAFTEISAYDNVILKGEAKLTPTNELTTAITLASSSGTYPTTVDVLSTAGFTDPESGETATAYIEEDSFTYTGITATSFVGVEGLSTSHSIGARVSQELESDSIMYDTKYLLPKLGDRLYKENRISDTLLFNQTQLNNVSMAFLQEFYKNHDKIKVDIIFAPYLNVGDTVSVTDVYNNKLADLYFIESISFTNGEYSLVLARYSD